MYFFEEEEVRRIWSGEGISVSDVTVDEDQEDIEDADWPDTDSGFEILNLGVDRRMLVNRQRKLKMYRCWMQGRFRKSVAGANEAATATATARATVNP